MTCNQHYRKLPHKIPPYIILVWYNFPQAHNKRISRVVKKFFSGNLVVAQRPKYAAGSACTENKSRIGQRASATARAPPEIRELFRSRDGCSVLDAMS